MLIQCEECKELVSDKANTCPHCGFPLKVRGCHNVDTDDGCLMKVLKIVTQCGRYLKAGLVSGDGTCPTFGMYVIQSTVTIIMHLGLCALLWLLGGVAEQYIPKPYKYIVSLPILFIAVGVSCFWIRIFLVFFPTLGKYEKHIKERNMETDLIFRNFILKKRCYQLYYWGFFFFLIVTWLIIVHFANGGDWSWVAEGNNYRSLHRY